MVDVIGGGEDLGLVDVIDLDRLQNARLGDMPDAHLRHDRNRNGLLDALDHRGITHTAHTTGRADVSRDALERHDGARARVLRDARLLGRRDVHDDAALEHLGEILVQFVAVGFHGDLLGFFGYAVGGCARHARAHADCVGDDIGTFPDARGRFVASAARPLRQIPHECMEYTCRVQ